MDNTNFFDKLDNAKMVLIGIGKGFSKGHDNDKLVEYYNKLVDFLAEKDYFVVNISNENNIKKSNFDMTKVAIPLDEDVPEEDNEKQWNEYTKWLQQTLNKDLFLLELGVGFDMPTMVRWPFEKIAKLNNKAFLYRVNENFPQLPDDIGDKGESVKMTVGEFLDTIHKERFGN